MTRFKSLLCTLTTLLGLGSCSWEHLKSTNLARPILSQSTHPYFNERGILPSDVISNCTEEAFTQYLDNFNWQTGPNGETTYQQRYFICGGANWQPNDPIWFYTGNEADVTLYLNHTGLMWENCDDFRCIMVFAEHRYFGKSLPFDTNKQDLMSEYLPWLSSDQALADFARLIQYLKTEWQSFDSAVIGFGGSYGGMLCSWFRIKYPQWMDGCIAGSAPTVSFEGLHPPMNYNFFAEGETLDCSAAGGSNDNCAQNFADVWPKIFSSAQTQSGRETLANAFALCDVPLTEAAGVNVAYWVTSALAYMTMGSYPYPSSYMLNGNGVLPAYPMRLGCNTYLSESEWDSDYDLMVAVRNAVAIFYNYSQSLTCFDMNQNGNNETTIDGQLWNYLYCTEIFQPFGQSGMPSDMFWKSEWDATAAAANCRSMFSNSGPRQYWAAANYGGWQIGSGGVSNIVFSNGALDPWAGAGVTHNLSDSLTALMIPEVGHHIDLFFSAVDDTAAIKNARLFELAQIRKWINERQIRINSGRKHKKEL